MLFSHSVIRRYTPPTCTLEIAAKSSPLSRWSERPLLKQLSFELRFDDPRSSEAEQTTIRGDRAQLELLCETVTSYVQNFLLHLSPTSLPLVPDVSAAFPHSTPDEVNTQEERLSPPGRVTQLQPSEEKGDEEDTQLQPYLQPRGLLAHQLFLGSLATEESGPRVDLSALQLFDLATALDEYNAEVEALPKLNRPIWRKVSPIWAGTAAAVLVAVGFTTALIRATYQAEPDQSATTAQPESPSTEETPMAALPSVPPARITPNPSPTLPNSLSSAEKLPPPPAVEIPRSPSQSSPQPQETQPQTPSFSIPPARDSTPPEQQTASAPQRQQAASPPKSPSSSTSNQNDTPSVARNNQDQQPSPTPSKTPTASPTIPTLPTLQPSSASPREARPETPSIATTSSRDSNQGDVARGTLFDNIPQIAEVRNYFQQRWEPPEGLTQTLEYDLVLSSDGSIQRITPLGQAAGNYIDRTDMPLVGEPFVSPVEGGGNPKIRLVLGSDGTVKTFLD